MRALARSREVGVRGEGRKRQTDASGAERSCRESSAERRAARRSVIAVLLARNGAHRIVTRSLAGGTESAAGARAQFTEGYRAERDGTERRNGR